MKLLVTGANGFDATHIIHQSLAQGHDFVVTVRYFKKQTTIFKGLTYVVTNLTHSDGWVEAMAGVDAILHVASPLDHENANDVRLIKEAVAGVEHVFEAAHIAGVKRIVMTPSQETATPLLRQQDLAINIFGLILKILN